MAQAAEADNNGRQRGEPARHKLKLLPEVVALLNKNNLRDSLVDPEINLLEAVRFFLEPLSDGSLPAYDIQKELFAALAKLPVNKDSLVASGIGKVIMFYVKSKRPEMAIKRQAERLFTDWTRPILRRTDDYRKKEFVSKEYDPSYVFSEPCHTALVIDLCLGKSLPTALSLPTTRLLLRALKRLKLLPISAVLVWRLALRPIPSYQRATSSSTTSPGRGLVEALVRIF
jgi:hypothetical protein